MARPREFVSWPVREKPNDAEPTVAVTRSPNAINARRPDKPSCLSRAVRAVAVSIRKYNFYNKKSSTRFDDSPTGKCVHGGARSAPA
eukprot:5818126-Prymnesium_polylepis.1